MTGDVISHDLEVGSTVEVPMIEGSPRYGVIRWIGNIPHGNKLIAGLEMVRKYFPRKRKKFIAAWNVYCLVYY